MQYIINGVIPTVLGMYAQSRYNIAVFGTEGLYDYFAQDEELPEGYVVVCTTNELVAAHIKSDCSWDTFSLRVTVDNQLQLTFELKSGKVFE